MSLYDDLWDDFMEKLERQHAALTARERAEGQRAAEDGSARVEQSDTEERQAAPDPDTVAVAASSVRCVSKAVRNSEVAPHRFALSTGMPSSRAAAAMVT